MATGRNQPDQNAFQNLASATQPPVAPPIQGCQYGVPAAKGIPAKALKVAAICVGVLIALLVVTFCFLQQKTTSQKQPSVSVTKQKVFAVKCEDLLNGPSMVVYCANHKGKVLASVTTPDGNTVSEVMKENDTSVNLKLRNGFEEGPYY